MNYKESKKILQLIKQANKVLINCHLRPDPDSVSSALTMAAYLKKLGKEVTVVSPDPISGELGFLDGIESIEHVSFDDIDFSDFDLFLILDTSTLSRAGISEELKIPIPLVKVDHHLVGEAFGDISLIDTGASSVAEMIYKLLADFNVRITPQMATTLLTGIISDSGSFQFHGAGAETLNIASDLIKFGADKSKIVYNLYRSEDFNLLKFWGEVIINMKVENIFTWSTVRQECFEECGRPIEGKSSAATMFSRIVNGTKFGIVMVEEGEKNLAVSFRARDESFDVSRIAKDLGGNGHDSAAAATILGLSFDEAVEKVLQTARKYASQ